MKNVKLVVDGCKDGMYKGYQVVAVSARIGEETILSARLVNKDVEWPEEARRWEREGFTFSCLNFTVLEGYEALLTRALSHPDNVTELNRWYRNARHGLS